MTLHSDDTQPKAPTGLHEAIQLQGEPPPPPPAGRNINCLSLVMILGVISMATALCLTITTLFGIAGAQDEYQALSTAAEAEEVGEVATQYALALDNLAAGNAELARDRLAFVTERRPDYEDAAAQLAQVELLLAATPTPTISQTPTPTTTPEPEATPATEGTAAEPLLSPTTPPEDDGIPDTPEEIYARAETAMNVSLYAEAIEWFDALVLLDPTYRRADVRAQRLEAYISLGMIYLRGQNDDGQDRLSQGVQLINRASELGNVSTEILYEADFVARYLAARAYVEGGAFGQARQVLARLCEENCDWSYRGVSVRDLLQQAGGA
ncbi:MAG: hypothetical protein ACLFTK_02955 [Anaerolineales bacterium]